MSEDKTRKASDENRWEVLSQMIVPIFLTLVSVVGMIVALILGYLVGVAIFAIVLIIFGSLASGVGQLGLDFRRDGMRYSAEKKERVRVDAHYEIDEVATPPPSRGKTAA